MARFHEYTEIEEKEFFGPVHEFIWDKHLVNENLDGQTAFYYAMEYIHEHFPKITAKSCFITSFRSLCKCQHIKKNFPDSPIKNSPISIHHSLCHSLCLYSSLVSPQAL